MATRASLQVARIAGIPVRIHATFLLLVAWVAFVHWQRDPELAAVGVAVAFLLVVFAIIVLHELSHALVARAFGVGTRDITLWPIGGVSSLERMPEEPGQELLIALAGPLVNVILAVFLGAGLVAAEGPRALLQFDFSGGGQAFLASLVWVNVALAGFNLLPAFPMDGGRALRGFLGMFMGRLEATQLAAGVGQALALVFGLVGLFVNPLLVVIAVFVWLGAGAERAHEELVSSMAGHTVARAMTPDPFTLRPDDPLATPALLLVRSGQRAYPVVEAGQVLGVLSESALLRGLAKEGARGRVRDHMDADPPFSRSDRPLSEAFRRLRETPSQCVVVVEEGHLVGLVTRQGLSAFLAVSSALGGGAPEGTARPRTHRQRASSGAWGPA